MAEQTGNPVEQDEAFKLNMTDWQGGRFSQGKEDAGDLIFVKDGVETVLDNYLIVAKTGLWPDLTLGDGSVIPGMEIEALIAQQINFELIGETAAGVTGGTNSAGGGAGFSAFLTGMLGDQLIHGPYNGDPGELGGGTDDDDSNVGDDSTAKVTVAVNGVNDAPEAVGFMQEMVAAIDFNPYVSDVEDDDPDTPAITNVKIVTDPVYGTLSKTVGDGEFAVTESLTYTSTTMLLGLDTTNDQSASNWKEAWGFDDPSYVDGSVTVSNEAGTVTATITPTSGTDATPALVVHNRVPADDSPKDKTHLEGIGVYSEGETKTSAVEVDGDRNEKITINFADSSDNAVYLTAAEVGLGSVGAVAFDPANTSSGGDTSSEHATVHWEAFDGATKVADGDLIYDGDQYLNFTIRSATVFDSLEFSVSLDPDGDGIDQFNANFTLRYVEATFRDSFSYQAVDSDGGVSAVEVVDLVGMEGGDGMDFIIGSDGDDQLTGGTGDDTFVFGADAGHDTIIDFSVDSDGDGTAEFGLNGMGDDVINLDALFDSIGLVTDTAAIREGMLLGDADQTDGKTVLTVTGQSDFSLTLAGIDLDDTAIQQLIDSNNIIVSES
jgi:hypothetical protein